MDILGSQNRVQDVYFSLHTVIKLSHEVEWGIMLLHAKIYIICVCVWGGGGGGG